MYISQERGSETFAMHYSLKCFEKFGELGKAGGINTPILVDELDNVFTTN
jgi:hypothetical protein